ncbi:hypothetical protein [Streptomyces cyaneus]|uniref:hypothetical protein n=1 Tax=Streptomyces cyaneus TaxID=1904 RepID=UPI000FF8A6D8|nr:hypothetical protein [Streptomyces cyaneus]
MAEPVVEAAEPVVEAEEEAERGRRQGLLAPALANLALGVPAIIPLYLTYWLLTEYVPLSCDAFATRPDMSNCDYHTLDHAPVMMFLLAVTGTLLLILLLTVDVLGPRRRGDARPGRWLAMATLIPVPFMVLLCLAKA